MSPEMTAIRNSAALSRMEGLSVLRVSGEDALGALDRVCPRELYLRDGRMLHTLFLTESAAPLADVYIGKDDREFFVVADGMAGADLEAHVRGHAPERGRFDIEDLSRSLSILSLNGPYAWEVLGELLGPEVIGLPYLSFSRIGRVLCCRAGKTGEFGYDLLVPAGEAGETEARLLEIGKTFDLAVAGIETLDQCALENWFFNVRREGRQDVTPLELQLQWRISYRKDCVGAAALAERRRAGPRVRLSAVVSDGAMAVGGTVLDDGREAGRIVNAGFSQIRGDWTGLALIETALAWPGLSFGGIRTVSPPLINNRSLHVSPQAHAYRTRHEVDFPPIVKE
jgi:glycine cleavage system aminomethyltransferase T